MCSILSLTVSGTTTTCIYNSDGTMDVRSSSGGNAYRHYMLTVSDGSSQQVYCVESGIAYNASDNTYTGNVPTTWFPGRMNPAFA